jgi:hypothetical protein
MTTSEYQIYLNTLLVKWVDILDLKDWEISIQISPKKCKKNSAMAYVDDDSSIKSALITFSNFKAFNNDFEYLEKTLIHELLHIKLALLHPSNLDTLEYKVLHQIINDLALSFYKAHYSIQK